MQNDDDVNFIFKLHPEIGFQPKNVQMYSNDYQNLGNIFRPKLFKIRLQQVVISVNSVFITLEKQNPIPIISEKPSVLDTIV